MVVCERDPDHRRVEQVPRIARLHRRAAPLLDTDKSPLLELLEAFADHRTAEAELLAEHRLRREDAPLGKGAADDPVRELLEHDGGEARRPPRSCPVQHERDAGRSTHTVHAKHHMF